MDAFSYLSVLLSIIIGLAITQVLQGYRGMLLARVRVRHYWPTLAWSLSLLVIATQLWWASFGLADHRDWTFAAFGIVLVQTVLLYMMAALVLPDFGDAAVDLRAHYYREARPFFAIGVAMLATSVGKDWLLDGALPEPRNLGFHLFFGALWGGAIVIRRQWYHEALALVAIASLALYITLLFARLG